MKNKQQTLAVSATPWWQKHTLLLLCALAFLVFANTIGHGYNMDDELVTRKQKLTSKGIRAIPEIFTSPYYSDDMGYAYEYRPVVLTSFAIEHQFFGDKPGVSHFFNVLLYVLTVVVLFKLLRKLLHAYSYWLTVLVVLLFAVHPLHSEVVASIKNRDEILALLGALGAWWFALKFIQDKKNAVLPLVLVFFTLAILSKMSILPLIFFIPLSAVFFVPTASSSRVFIVSLVLLVPSLLFLPLGHVNNYILLSLATLILPIGVFKLTRTGWQTLKNEIWETLHTRKNDPEPQDTPLVEGWLRTDWKALFTTYTLAWGFIYAAFTYISWREESLYWSLGLVVAFLVSVYFSKKEEGGFLFFLFSLAASLLWIKLEVYVFFEFIIFFVLFYVLSPKSKYKGLPLLFAFVVFEIANSYSSPLNFLSPIFYLPFLLSIRLSRQRKWILYPIYIYYLGFVGAFLFSVFKLWRGEAMLFDFVVGAVNFSLVTVALFALLRKYFFYAFAGIFLLVNLAVAVHLLSWESATVHPTLSEPTATVVAKKEVNQPAVGILYPKLSKNARPILFAEMPVTTDSSLEERLGFAMEVMGFYLKKMIVPYPLGYYYGYAFFKPVSLFEALPLLSLFIHLLLLVAAFLCVKKHPPLSFGIFLYLGSLLLFSGLLYPVVGVAGDRFAYLATLGWAIALAYVFVRFVLARKTWPTLPDVKPKALWPFAVLCFFYVVITFLRNGDWKSPLILMEHDIEYLNESAQAHNLYALNLMRETMDNRKIKPAQQAEMQKLAVEHFDRAVQIWPQFFNAAYDKGRASLLLGDYNSAIDGFEKAVAIGPQEGFIQPYLELSQLYLRTGRYVDYLRNSKALLRFSPEAEAYNLVARGFYMTGRNDSAKTYLHKGLNKYPDNVSLKKNLAEIFKVENQKDSVDYYLGQ